MHNRQLLFDILNTDRLKLRLPRESQLQQVLVQSHAWIEQRIANGGRFPVKKIFCVGSNGAAGNTGSSNREKDLLWTRREVLEEKGANDVSSLLVADDGSDNVRVDGTFI